MSREFLFVLTVILCCVLFALAFDNHRPGVFVKSLLHRFSYVFWGQNSSKKIYFEDFGFPGTFAFDEYGRPFIITGSRSTKRITGTDAIKVTFWLHANCLQPLRPLWSQSPDGDVTVTNDGATIMKTHGSVTITDDEIGDGTLVFRGSHRSCIHPIRIADGFELAAHHAEPFPIDPYNKEPIVNKCHRQMAEMAVDAVLNIETKVGGRMEEFYTMSHAQMPKTLRDPKTKAKLGCHSAEDYKALREYEQEKFIDMPFARGLDDEANHLLLQHELPCCPGGIVPRFEELTLRNWVLLVWLENL
ncbi:T-complex protein 1 subunit epsilon [Lucilia cuprina]|nr:T-complex protein 1 subunit epsilon [Lucilia cuprina]